MQEGATQVKIALSDNNVLNVTFSDYGITELMSKTTYILRITIHQEENTTQRHSEKVQFVIFQIVPKNATVEISGDTLTLENGVVQKFLPLGEYHYMVRAQGYSSRSGTIFLNSDSASQTIKYALSPTEMTVTYGKHAKFHMMPVDGGTVTLGDGSEENPLHEVQLDAFRVQETEVTQEQWKEVMRKNPSKKKGKNLPVTDVSWEDCQLFLEKLNGYTKKEFRLLTEAEWEYVARGGKFMSGETEEMVLDSVAWYKDNAGGKLPTVATRQPNRLGVVDMLGGVSEWCQDWYGKIKRKKKAESNPQGPETGQERVLRGGSFLEETQNCQPTKRGHKEPFYKSGDVGLRLAY